MKSRSRLCALIGVALCFAGAASAATASAATPAWSPIAASGPTNLPPVQSEVQRLGVDAEGGTFSLTFESQTTAAIPFDAEPAAVESALNVLPSIAGAGGSVSVSGGPGGLRATRPYYVSFVGSFADTDVAQMTSNASLLLGTAHSATVLTAVPGGPGTGEIAIYAQNIGGLVSSGEITLSVTLPAGVTTSAKPASRNDPDYWNCSPAVSQSFTCTSTAAIAPGVPTEAILAPVVSDPTASGTKPVEITVTGGGANGSASFSMPLTVSSEAAEPGVQSFAAGAYDADGAYDHRAGGHPYSGPAAILVNTYRNIHGEVVPVGEFKDINVDLPPGFLGNPIATPQCPETQLAACDPDTIVGTAGPILSVFGQNAPVRPVYDVQAPFGYPGKFYFEVSGVPIQAVGDLRSDEDYGLTVGSLNTAQIATVYGSFFTFWGAPADSVHDAQRCDKPQSGGFCATPEPSDAPNTAFLTNPVDCAREALEPPMVRLRVTLWQSPLVTHRSSVGVPAVTECDQLKFGTSEEPVDFTFEPSDTKSDSTASFRTSLTVPSEGLTNPDKLTTPEIKDTVVQLPEGVVLNASGADGLQACSLDQIGYKGNDFPMPNPMRFNKEPNTCPDASKIGTGELKTALLEDPLKGALYLAAQGDGNPYGSLFAIYLVIEDPRHGIYIKLPGRVDPDPQTGQMKVTFQNLPQVPFTRLDLNLKGGNRSALASPTTCGTYTTTATNTPWSAPDSGPPTDSSNGFEINQGPNGMPCAKTPAERPFDIAWDAGAKGVQAGASGPFTFNVTRPDGSQELSSLELNTPPGVSASLKGIPYCTEAEIASAQSRTGKEEQANPACPAASQVGTLQTGAGSGPTPFYVGGKIYLAGPYKGAPISVVVVTPAVAGPFDLGNVVVRSAVNINRATAQVSAISDPIPQFLKGVGLRIRDVQITLDRKDWTINPTSCDASTVNLRAYGNSGAIADRSTRFQVGNCGALPFGPKLRASLKGATKRGGHPAFTAVVDFPAGQANTKDVQVTIPHSEFLEQAHINTICTRVQAAANACPPGAIYGYAEAETPLIDGKLVGPVFLKANPNHKLPDLAIALKGPANQPVEVEFAGRIDSVKGQIRNTIEGLPDVPVSKFVLRMKGGRKGLLANSRDLCATKVTKMTVNMVAHNNKATQFRPPLTRTCKKAKKGKRAKQRQSKLTQLSAIW